MPETQVSMSSLCSVSIDWKMLTPHRPENSLEDQMFSRLVELNRLRLMTRQEEDEQVRQDPDRVVRLPSENKGGVREVYIKVNTTKQFQQ